MARQVTILFLLAIAGAATAVAWAQPPDLAIFPGHERAREGRGHERRLEQMTEYLELSDAQATEFQAITERHAEKRLAHREQVGTLREEFRELADQDEPDLEQLGRMALDLHREMKAAHSSRQELVQELEVILTPEQTERLAALRAARELGSNRDHRGSRGARRRPGKD